MVKQTILGLCLAGLTYGQSVLPGDPCFSSNSAVWASPRLQWASGRFTCTINVQPGIYIVDFVFQEPTVTAVGQRLFTVSMAGATSPVYDLYKLAGTQPYNVRAEILVSFSGPMVISFVATVRNPVVSSITITRLGSIITVGGRSAIINDPTGIFMLN